MKPYIFHINLYDLASIGALFAGLMLALLLGFAKRADHKANLFLSSALAVIVLKTGGLTSLFLLALGPLLYFYVRQLTSPEQRFRREDMLHFCPLPVGYWMPAWLVLISVIIYLYLSHRLVQDFYNRLQPVLMDRPRFAFRRLNRALILLGLLCVLSLFNAVFYLTVAFVLIGMAAEAILEPDNSARLAMPITDRSDVREKGRRLKETVATNRFYEDAELTLTTLAVKLMIHPHDLSRMLNLGLEKSFSDFINEFRVRDIARKMQDPAYDRLTLLGIAYESGFNSKRTFNRVFKEMTGKTPVEYKNSLKKEGPIDKMAPLSRIRHVILRLESPPNWGPEKLNRNYMFRNYFKIAWRNITRNKVYTAINVLGLSLGVCACLIVYLITTFELSYDTFHPDKERIYRIVTHLQLPEGRSNEIAGSIALLPIQARAEISGFENATAFYNYFPKITIRRATGPDKKFDAPKEGETKSPVIVAEPQYFKIFKYQWLLGNPAIALNEPFKVVLTEQEAHKYFGAIPLEDIIGKEVIYNDSLRVTVSGIIKDWNKNTDFNFKDFISFATVQNSFLKNEIDLKNWGMWNYNSQGFVKLAKNVSPGQIAKQFPQFIKKHFSMPPGMKVGLALQHLSDIHFNNKYEDSYSRQTHLPTLYGLMAISAFILIIAAINFINLSTAQSLRRSKEVGVRKVLGSSKASLTIQFLVETVIVTVAAVVIAVFITNPISTSFHSIIPKGVELHLFTPSILVFLVLIVILTSLLAGFYPARVLSSYLPVLTLKGQVSQKLNGKSYLRKTLITFQFTVSLVFIIGTLIITNQIHFILNKDLGFNKDAIITIHSNYDKPASQVSVFAGSLKQIPGISLVSRHQQTPASDRHNTTIINYKGPGGNKIDAAFDICDENYVPLFGLKLVAGHNLMRSDTIKEFLVNEKCAAALGFKNPEDALGKMVKVGINDAQGPIVGVVKDFHAESLHAPIAPFFMASLKTNERAVSIKLATRSKQVDNFKATIAQIKNAWAKVYPDDKFEYRFFDETIAALYDKEQKTAKLMTVAMAIAIFISCMGLFGLATFTAQQRVKEIGIRKVLGASTTRIAAMLSKDFLILVTVALLIASPIAYYFMHRWLQDFAYRVNISAWTFLLSGLAAIAIALATVSFQAIRAAVANPVKSLRSE